MVDRTRKFQRNLAAAVGGTTHSLKHVLTLSSFNHNPSGNRQYGCEQMTVRAYLCRHRYMHRKQLVGPRSFQPDRSLDVWGYLMRITCNKI